jgi:hypothetical protein
MTDVQVESITNEEAATPRRRRRTTAAGTTTTGRRRLRGADLIESLRESVEQLIKENRALKRQLAKAIAGGGTSAAPGVERTLRSIQRRVLRAVGGDSIPKRRPRTATTRPRATANGRRARTARSGEE